MTTLYSILILLASLLLILIINLIEVKILTYILLSELTNYNSLNLIIYYNFLKKKTKKRNTCDILLNNRQKSKVI